MALLTTPGASLTPSSTQTVLSTNYIDVFNFDNQYLPDLKEEEFARYGNRTVSSFLRLVGAELPCESDLIKWSEQGRLHTKYVNCESGAAAAQNTATITVNDTIAGNIAIRKGQTVMLIANNGTGHNKGIVVDVDTAAGEFDVAYYEAGGQVFAISTPLTVFIYGSEFKKGTTGMEGSLDSEPLIFDNNPVIKKDTFAVNGSDMTQIGWIEAELENGKTGYLWYLKSEYENTLRFNDYLETSAIEDVPAATGSGVKTQTTYANAGDKGSEGVFYVVEQRGNLWGAGNPTSLQDFDTVIGRLDQQGSIEENVLFVNRNFSLDIDDMLAAQNSYGAGGTSYGLFNNDADMALKLGFKGFNRGGYQFYKQDWKYLNDPTMRGGLSQVSGSGAINGLLVPAGTTSVYDQIMGSNVKRPFLHVRYRANAQENRRYKTWITGSAGGASNSDLDAMVVNYLSERCVCTLGANNFMLFEA
jgi:hypothetical protein